MANDAPSVFFAEGHWRINGASVDSTFWTGFNPVLVQPRQLLAKRIPREVILEGSGDRDVLAQPGDWLVTDVPPTHAWVIRDGDFQRMYEKAP